MKFSNYISLTVSGLIQYLTFFLSIYRIYHIQFDFLSTILHYCNDTFCKHRERVMRDLVIHSIVLRYWNFCIMTAYNEYNGGKIFSWGIKQPRIRMEEGNERTKWRKFIPSVICILCEHYIWNVQWWRTFLLNLNL